MLTNYGKRIINQKPNLFQKSYSIYEQAIIIIIYILKKLKKEKDDYITVENLKED
mgnify:CR=1 FL=1|tara:strand:- start:2215 stop:2379 length:165 start_codon:yes stop_codon:yes gene_type:complete